MSYCSYEDGSDECVCTNVPATIHCGNAIDDSLVGPEIFIPQTGSFNGEVTSDQHKICTNEICFCQSRLEGKIQTLQESLNDKEAQIYAIDRAELYSIEECL